jgi:hypothetical protein
MNRVLASVVLIGVLSQSVPSLAGDNDAEQLYLEGQKAYDDKRYDGALVAWLRSYDQSHLPGLLFNIAQAYRLRGLAGDCTKASESYQKFIAQDPQSPQRAAAEKFVVELRPCAVPRPTPKVPVEPVTATVDASLVNPRSGPQPRFTGTQRVAFLTGGFSTAILVGGAVFGYRASKIGNDVTLACAKGCQWSTVADLDAEGRTAERAQWVLLGVGGVGVVASAALYWYGGRSTSSGVAIAPLHSNGAVVTWSSSW